MPTGRPTKLTPAVQEQVVKALAAGNYFETACAYAGIDRMTGLEWIRRGEGRMRNRAANEVYAEFADAVRKASTDAEVRTVANWQKAVPEDWRAAKDFLARRYPTRWQERKTLSVSDLTSEQIVALLAEEAGDGGEEARPETSDARPNGEGEPV